MPGFQFWGGAQCDASGDLYFHAGAVPQSLIVLKIDAAGSHVVYGVAGEDAAGLFMVAFRVSPEGKVSLLAGKHNDELHLLEFGDDPTSPSRVRLEVPKGLYPLGVQNFLVLPTGGVLLQGYLQANEGQRKPSQGYLAEFDASGRLVHESKEKIPDALRTQLATSPASASATQGEDGLLYLLELDKILVVSQAGHVVRKIKLSHQKDNFRPEQIYLAGARLAVVFAKEELNKPIVMQIQILDSTTGEQLRSYDVDDSLGNNLVCFSKSAFTFLGVDEHGQSKLMTAPAD